MNGCGIGERDEYGMWAPLSVILPCNSCLLGSSMCAISRKIYIIADGKLAVGEISLSRTKQFFRIARSREKAD